MEDNVMIAKDELSRKKMFLKDRLYTMRKFTTSQEAQAMANNRKEGDTILKSNTHYASYHGIDKSIDIPTCQQLLVRCQLMLSVRKQVYHILSRIITCEQLVQTYSSLPLQGENTVSLELAAQKKVNELDVEVTKIRILIQQLIEERHLIIGNVFIYEGMDISQPQSLKIRINAILL